ncbi:hypothetical protein MASR1M48_16360 [Lactococcus petauri]
MEELLNQTLEFFKNSSGLSGMAEASAIIFLIVGFVKSSALSFIWDKLGKFKPFAAPVLAIAGAITNEFAATGKISLQVALLALGHGMGALAIAELFDAFKGVKGLGKVQLMVIGLMEKLLLKGEAQTTTKKE